MSASLDNVPSNDKFEEHLNLQLASTKPIHTTFDGHMKTNGDRLWFLFGPLFDSASAELFAIRISLGVVDEVVRDGKRLMRDVFTVKEFG
jgi:hypothetical protein